MSMRRSLSMLLSAALLFSQAAVAQTVPNNPVYIPTQVLGVTTLTAAGDVTFNTNGDGSIYFRVAGTFTGLAATVQGTESRATSPTYSDISVQKVGGSRLTAITGTGLYRANVAGMARVRLHVTNISTGSVSVTSSAGPGTDFVSTLGATRPTYSAVITGLAPAASATDFFTLTGSATTTVRVLEAGCDGTATAIGAKLVQALLRSTANSAGTSSAGTAVPYDSNNAAATATVLGYTANPTTGTGIGNIGAAVMQLNQTATATYAARPLLFQFGQGQGMQEVVLHGVTQVFALNGAGASFPSGTSLNCHVVWTEE